MVILSAVRNDGEPDYLSMVALEAFEAIQKNAGYDSWESKRSSSKLWKAPRVPE
jgi:hypothetical protein